MRLDVQIQADDIARGQRFAGKASLDCPGCQILLAVARALRELGYVPYQIEIETRRLSLKWLRNSFPRKSALPDAVIRKIRAYDYDGVMGLFSFSIEVDVDGVERALEKELEPMVTGYPL